MSVERVERGWPGHYILANLCNFRRNTLLTHGETRIVVSSVGLLKRYDGKNGFEMIGCDRYYETMAFFATYDGKYWDADVSSGVQFDSPWCVDKWDADDVANDQHDAVVAEITRRMETGEFDVVPLIVNQQGDS